MPALCRIVRTDITHQIDPQDWTVILPEHEKDILTGSTHLKVTLLMLQQFSDLIHLQQTLAWPVSLQPTHYLDNSTWQGLRKTFSRNMPLQSARYMQNFLSNPAWQCK